MKSLVLISMLISLSVSAHDPNEKKSKAIANAAVVAKLMSSPEVQKELKGRSITNIKVSQATVSTTWTYTLSITSLEPGLGPNGPSSHPCYTKVEQDIIGGIAGPVVMSPKIETVCAMN